MVLMDALITSRISLARQYKHKHVSKRKRVPIQPAGWEMQVIPDKQRGSSGTAAATLGLLTVSTGALPRASYSVCLTQYSDSQALRQASWQAWQGVRSAQPSSPRANRPALMLA